MKYVKMLGLLAVAAAALMAFAGTASATLTEVTPEEKGTHNATTVHGQSSGATSLTGTVAVTCQKSTVGGTITTNDANEASGPVETLTFEECGTDTVEVITKGTLKITDSAANATTGTVSSNGAKVTILLHRGFPLNTTHCIYKTTNTTLGTFTESHHDPEGPEGSYPTATLHINSISLEREDTSFGCGEHSTWEGTYTLENPRTLLLD
jgi:hypothetical protein